MPSKNATTKTPLKQSDNKNEKTSPPALQNSNDIMVMKSILMGETFWRKLEKYKSNSIATLAPLTAIKIFIGS